MSTLWGENPSILSCGHLCDPLSAFKWEFVEGQRQSTRWCNICEEWKTWIEAPNLDLTEE